MAEEFANKIKRLELENFTCFGKVAMDFSPGINVFIGENGTGKTHLLKAIFMSTNIGLLDGVTPILKANDNSSFLLAPAPTKAFLSNYYPPSVRSINLIKKGTPSDKSGIIKFKGFGNENNFGLQIDTVRNEWDGTFQMKHKGVFIPQQEVLSWFRGFIASYEERDSAIDPTYYLLAKSLALSKLKGEKLNDAIRLSKELEESIGVTVQLEGDEFFIYYNQGGGIRSALEASGINKLSQMLYLVLNGSLTKNTILIWDEPEVGLNPKYIKLVAQFLISLANAGCQIFVTTHDYLLPYELSLSKEYEDVVEGKVPPMKFFTLMKGDDGTVVESGETMYDLPYDSIMEGHLQFHEKREQLQRSALKQ
ncbi:MAG: AAA family ATPase [Saprospiraceae bacterium]|nr:AAA family ATPase [Saprospiraceae bacterium]